MHLPCLAMYFCVHNCMSPSNDLCSSGMQQQETGTVTHSLIMYQFLTDLQMFIQAQSCFEIFSLDFQLFTSLVPRPQEKRSGNFREFKPLLCCLNVGSTNQISERSHDNSKTQLCNALTRRSHAHSTSIAITRSCSVGDDFCLNDFYFTSVVQPTANSCRKAPFSQLEELYHMHQTVGMHIVIAMTSHPYTV